MCHWILTHDTGQLIVRSGVRSAIHTDRPNKAIEIPPSKKMDEDEFPIIAPRKINGDSGEHTTPHEKHFSMTVDPQDLIDIYIDYETISRNGKKSTRKVQVKEQLDEDNFRVEFKNGR